MQFSIEMKKSGMFWKEPAKAMGILEKNYSKLINKVVNFVYKEAIIGTPVFVGGEGLSGSIFRKIEGQRLDLRGVVATPVVYAGFIETGQPAHFPNVDNLSKWVRLKLGVGGKLRSATFKIARSISKKGVKPHWMFRNAYNKGVTILPKEIKETETKTIQEWNR